VLVLLFILAVVSLPLIEHYGEDSTGGRLTQVGVNIAWYAGSVGLIYAIVSRRGATWRDLGLRQPRAAADGNPWLRLLGSIVIYILMAYGLVIAYGYLIQILGLDFLEPSQQLPDDTYDSTAVVIATGALVIFGAPFVEETLFRGFLFAKLRMHLRFIAAAALSGGLFSLAHGDPGLVVPFTAVGVVLALAYERTGTLWGSIGLHFCFNTITFLVLVLVPDAR
jgi:membrane protease YdiL (CAAX protease family)